MKNKKKLITIYVVLIILVVGIFVVFKNNKKEIILDDVIIKGNGKMAMFIEQLDGSYEENKEKNYPKGNYKVNISKSKCTDSNGNIIENVLSLKNSKLSIRTNKETYCYLYFDRGEEIFEFDYTGGEEVFTIPYDGNYVIETWGAQGGSADEYYGGYGAYSTGIISKTKGDKLYINVGGVGISTYGSNNGNNPGSYNGGGSTFGNSDSNSYWSTGGGATHIATETGLLSTFENKKDKIIIVSGGGGGSTYNTNTPKNTFVVSGNGGGFNGNNSGTAIISNNSHYSVGGKQELDTSSSCSSSSSGVGAFGIGSSCIVAGGGGGYYGGNCCTYTSGGGSGYIGNSNLTNKHMTCYECTESNEESTKTISNTCVSENPVTDCSKKGNGYVRIRYIGEKTTIYKDNTLNGTDPAYGSNLIPVKIENDGTVKKADISEEWYNYTNKKWANTVMLKNNKIYNSGETIPESNIKAYFVWIPKYKYKLFDMGNYTTYINSNPPATSNAKTIEIAFGTENTTDTSTSCVTPMLSGESGTCAVNKWMTHPAFISMTTNGLWVGKFETTGVANAITVKPNEASLYDQNVKTQFEEAYNFSRKNDSHMMKNTEWGAVAYLSHSNYGINTEIRINNNNDFKTGYAATDTSNQSIYPGTYGNTNDITLPYNTTTGVKASTTGNINGVYDMNGGINEYMSSFIKDLYGESGFDATSIANYNSKYFDIYTTIQNNYVNYNYRILGDATGEMGPFYLYKDTDNQTRQHNNWYSDYSVFVLSPQSYFIRGGNVGTGYVSSQFYFGISSGEKYTYTFRLVLTN